MDDESLQRAFSEANAAAIAAVAETATWLDGQKAAATANYALGAERFLAMLKETQGVDVTLAELEAAGEADLARNLAALEAACADYAPGTSTADCVLQSQADKPAEGAVAGARRQLPALKQFLVAEDLVSIPGSEDALVAEAPPHKRFNAAYIDIPGPFEKGLPSVYYIAPPDPNWSEADQLAYIPGESDLLAVSVHEVWPGHFLQFLHANRAENRVGRYFSTYTFVEGWAHYTEEMMLEAGLGSGDPEVRIGQLIECVVAQRALPVSDRAACEGHERRGKPGAVRGEGLPGFRQRDPAGQSRHLRPGLSQLHARQAHDHETPRRLDGRAAAGGKAWKAFHDEFLSYGSPPIPLVRRAMLGSDFDSKEPLLPQSTAPKYTRLIRAQT